jgi:hypothetical protein
MKKILKNTILALLLLQMLCILSSCGGVKQDDNAAIQIWHYHSSDRYHCFPDEIIESAKEYCEKSNIPLEINIIDKNSLNYKDYILKRNLAAASGNMIVVDDPKLLVGIAKQHADYTKLDSYNKLLDAYKGRSCIQLGVYHRMFCINKDAMKHYDIDLSDKSVITYYDYLKIKQEMKTKGANFNFNLREYYEVIYYYLNLNGLAFIDIEEEVLNNKQFKDKFKKTIIEICNEFKTKDYSQIDIKQLGEIIMQEMPIFDNSSGIALSDKPYSVPGCLINPYKYYEIFSGLGLDVANINFVVDPFIVDYSPSIYIYKTVTNNKIYELADYIASDTNYIKANQTSKFSLYVPSFDTENVRNSLYLDENWKFVGNDSYTVISESKKKLADGAFETFVKDKEKSKEVADYLFNDSYNYFDRNDKLNIFINTTIDEIAKKLSADKISLEKFNSSDEEINKFLDEKIDEFIYNFRVQNE